MDKTIKVIKLEDLKEDYSWALALSDSERVNLSTKLTQDLWVASTGKPFPTLARHIIARLINPNKSGHWEVVEL